MTGGRERRNIQEHPRLPPHLRRELPRQVALQRDPRRLLTPLPPPEHRPRDLRRQPQQCHVRLRRSPHSRKGLLNFWLDTRHNTDVCTQKKLGFGYWVGYYTQILNPKPKNIYTQTQNTKFFWVQTFDPSINATSKL